MTNYDEDETSWTTLSIVFAVIIATLGYRLFGPDREDVPQEKEPAKVPETKANEKEEEPKEETARIPEVPVTVLESSPKVSETINEEKEESNSTGSSEFERISNSEANDMPDENEDDKEAAEERIEEPALVEQVEEELPKVDIDETRFLSFVDTTLEGQCEAEKEKYSPVTPDEESCVAESPESEDSKMSMRVNFDSEDIVKTIDIVHDDEEVLEESKSDQETTGAAQEKLATEQVVDAVAAPVVAQTTVAETIVTEAIDEPSRSNSPSIRTEPSDDEDPLEELKSSSPILVSDQDVELVKKEIEKTESVEETEKVTESNFEKKKESKSESEAVTEDAFIDTEEDIVKTIDIAKVDAAIDALMGDAPIRANEETKLEQVDSTKAENVEEEPIVPTSEPAVESETAAVENKIDESLTGLEEYVPEESIVQETEKSTLEDNKEVSESSEIVGSGNETNTTVADESLSGLEMSLPVLECTAVGDEIQEGKWADNTILSSAGDARADDLKDIAADEDVSEKEIKKAQLQEINKLLEENNLLGDDVKVDDQVKMYTG